jgi:hypothetical protein
MKRLALLAGSLAVFAGGLALLLSARPGNATAPPANGNKAEPPPKIASSRITQVTIYPDSALVTREVEVPQGDGVMELVVSPLPHATVNSSLYSEGADGIRVLTTRFRSRPVLEDTREEVRKLEDEIKKLGQSCAQMQANILALQNNIALLAKLETFAAASTTHATEKGKLDSEATITLAKYLMEGRLEKTKELTQLQQQHDNLREQLVFAQRKLNNLTAGTSRTEREAIIVVDKVNNAGGKVRLNYLVSSASWKPAYKLRSGKTSKDAVTLEYLAAVMQHTGEDWSRVDVTLSTAQPMLNSAAPELHTLAVAVAPRGTPMAGVNLSGLQLGLQLGGAPGGALGALGGPRGAVGGPGAGGGAMPTTPPVPGESRFAGGRAGPAVVNPGYGGVSADQLQQAARQLRAQVQTELLNKREKDANVVANTAALLEQANELVVMAEGKKKPGDFTGKASKNEGPSVTYRLSSRLSIPSRNDDQVVEVAKLELAPDYFYKAVPVLTPHVYRQANLTNNSKYVLLPGEATMYTGTDFVGRQEMPLVAIGETFTVGFGTDPQLQVQRAMLDKQRSLQGGNQILRFEYRILVSSYKPEKVRVQVWDRLPHAENEQMNVNLVKASPELCKDALYEREERVNNLLRWDLDIEAGMRGEKARKIQYEFKLELDKQAAIGSFQTK